MRLILAEQVTLVISFINLRQLSKLVFLKLNFSPEPY